MFPCFTVNAGLKALLCRAQLLCLVRSDVKSLRAASRAKPINAAFLDIADTFVRFENSISTEDKEWVRIIDAVMMMCNAFDCFKK